MPSLCFSCKSNSKNFLNRIRSASDSFLDYIFDTEPESSVSDALELKNSYYRKIFETSIRYVSKLFCFFSKRSKCRYIC